MITTKKRIELFLISVCFLLIANSCDDGNEFEPLTGQLIGHVYLYGKSNSDNNEVKVTVEGSTPLITKTTNENGEFIIDSLKCGTYNFIFDKEGFCQNRIVGYQFVGGNKPSSLIIGLSALSMVKIDSLVIQDLKRESAVVFLITGKLTDPTGIAPTYIQYYISNTPDVSFKSYITTEIIQNFTEELSFLLWVDTKKFPVGSTLFMIIYPSSGGEAYYIDMDSGAKIYSSINIMNPSNVVSITIPDFNTPPWK